MMYSTFNRKTAILGFLVVLACSEKVNHHNIELEKAVSSVSQFAVIDLDRCNSCFSESGEKLNLSINDSSSIVIILSNSKKKAFLFGKENEFNFIWDSTRYFENYVENRSFIFKSK
jgi:hypothetical protein